MGRRVAEHFENPPVAAQQPLTQSPALANLLATPNLVAVTSGPTPQVDTLKREQDAVKAAQQATPPAKECPPPKECPPCPTCPDMSQYIRMDEIPCWNCTLP
jgi:hypothetical protein